MPRLDVATRKRVIVLRRLGYSVRDVQRRLSQEGIAVSVRSLQRLCSKFDKKHTIRDLPRATKPRLLTPEMLSTIEDFLRKDDELTARKLREKLCEKFMNFPDVSLTTIKRNRKECGWVLRGPIIAN